MLYIAQVIAYTGLMYLVYLLFLRNKPLHGFNRLYLLSSIVLPVIIPFITLPEAVYKNAPAVTALQMELPEFVVAPAQQAAATNALNIVWLLYGAVSVLLFVLMIYRWARLHTLISKHTKQVHTDHTVVYNTGYGPGSWMQYILLPGTDADETVIRHELVHIRLRHSIDILLTNTIQVLFWPNIFLLSIKKELTQVHEFQADAVAVADVASYSKLLVSSAFNTCTLPLTHSFIIHPIKRRIMMLSKNNRKTKFYFGVLAGVAALFLLFNIISLQSCKSKTWELKENTTAKSASEMVYKTVEKMPEFNGNLMQFMADNVKYPEQAKANNIEGRVNVQFTVSSTGEIKDVKAVGKNPVDSSLKRAAVEAVSKMPDWIPGEKDGKKVAVQFTMPVSFKL